MQYRVYDRQTLEYKDGGFVRSYTIDDDYIVNNNSTISVVKKNASAKNTFSDINVGDIVALIKDSGAFHKGVITSVDDTALTISYKSDKELFNDNMLNVYAAEFIDNDAQAAGRFGIDIVAAILKSMFVDTTDRFKALPIKFVTSGDVLDDKGEPKMLWNWSNDSINIVDWLVELFEKYNVSLSWSIDFNMPQPIKQRRPQYVCTLSAITNSGGIIKDNVAMQTITYTTKDLPDATVCIVISSETKSVLKMSSGKNLLDPEAGKADYYIVRHEADETLSAAWVIYENRTDSKLSGYIRMRDTYNTPETGFTYSQKRGDNVQRAIVAYDKNYNKIGYINYKPNTTGPCSFSFNLNTFTMLGASGEEEIANRRKQIRWFSICYCATAEEVQLEKGDKKTEYDDFDIPSIFYLYEKDGVYSISTESDLRGKYRMLPVKTVITAYNENNADTSENMSPQIVAEEKLMPSQFNQAIEIKINGDSKMFDFTNAKFGDLYKIINERGIIDSNYTGYKRTSEDKWVTLYFGLGRQQYTDLVQIRLRKDRYNEIYNEGK